MSVFGPGFQFELTPEVLAFEMSMDFSTQIIKKCNELGITFSELARRVGIKPSTLSEKLNGQNMTLKSMAELALAVGCDAEAPRLIPQAHTEGTIVASVAASPIKTASDLDYVFTRRPVKSVACQAVSPQHGEGGSACTDGFKPEKVA